MLILSDAERITAAVGSLLGTSPWLTITQERIDAFADATDDHQWIHVDVKASASGPYGRTIAHGYLVLGLIPHLAREIYLIEGASMLINYGLDRVRFPNPVPVGSRLRLSSALRGVENTSSGLNLRFEHTVEIEDQVKPACVAQSLSRVVF